MQTTTAVVEGIQYEKIDLAVLRFRFSAVGQHKKNPAKAAQVEKITHCMRQAEEFKKIGGAYGEANAALWFGVADSMMNDWFPRCRRCHAFFWEFDKNLKTTCCRSV